MFYNICIHKQNPHRARVMYNEKRVSTILAGGGINSLGSLQTKNRLHLGVAHSYKSKRKERKNSLACFNSSDRNTIETIETETKTCKSLF